MTLSPYFRLIPGSPYMSGGAGDAVPFFDDLTFDYYKRDSGSLVLKDKITENNAAVVGGYVGVFDGASYVAIPTITMVGDFNISFDVNLDILSGTATVIGESISFAVRFSTSGNLQVRINDVSYNLTFSTPLIGQLSFNISRVGTLLTTIVSGDINDTASITTNTDDFIINEIGRRGLGDLYYTGILSSLNLNDQAIYPLNNHVYDSVSGLEATNNGVIFELLTDTTPQSTLDALDNGYFELSGGEQVINPQFALPVGATEYPANKLHNFTDSYIDFNPDSSVDAIYDIFDRSNVTIYNANARLGYYEVTNPFLWHPTELDFDSWNAMTEPTYRYRNFTGIKNTHSDKLNMFEIFSYGTQKTDQDLRDVKDYINYI